MVLTRRMTSPGTSIAANLEVPHVEGQNVVWCADRGLRCRPRFEPPLCRHQRPLTFAGRPTRAFGLWSIAPDDPEWEGRRTSVLIHTPLLAEAEENQERHDEIDAARREDAGEQVPPDQPRFRCYPGFVAELLPVDGERLLVASVPRQATVADTLELVMRGLRPLETADHLERGERLRLPCIRAHLVAPLDEGGRLDLAFELDEGGASAPSRPASTGLCLPPRDLVCRTPFMVVALRGSAPALVLWIENSELLIPAVEP
jgi:hypothetical protein